MVLCFRNFSYNFCFLLEDLLIPLVIQEVECFFCFKLILTTEKHSSYSESIMLKKIMYDLLAFLHYLTLLQFISRNLILNVAID